MKWCGLRIAGILIVAASLLCPKTEALASETANVPIQAEAEISSTYSVKANPYLELVWNSNRKDYEGVYRVGVRGRIASGKAIRIIPDATFEMSSGKNKRTGTVKQEFTRWAQTSDRADTLVLSESAYVATSGTAAIKLPGTAVYRGGIQFTFSVE